MDILSYMIGKQSGGGITPTGKLDITNTNEVDVSTYATAQVVDSDLVAENIKKDVDILGVVGTFEGGGGGITPQELGFSKMETYTFVNVSNTSLDRMTFSHTLGVVPTMTIVSATEPLTQDLLTRHIASKYSVFVGSKFGETERFWAKYDHNDGRFNVDTVMPTYSNGYTFMEAGIEYEIIIGATL